MFVFSGTFPVWTSSVYIPCQSMKFFTPLSDLKLELRLFPAMHPSVNATNTVPKIMILS